MRWGAVACLLAVSACDRFLQLNEVGPSSDAVVPYTCPPDYIRVGDGFYRVVGSPTGFLSAATDCADDEQTGSFTGHTHLIVLSSDAERDRVRDSLGGADHWLGISNFVDKQNYLWVTDEDVSGSWWAAGEPNNPSYEYCVIMKTDGSLDTVACEQSSNATKHGYGCECDAYPDDPSHY